MYTDISTVVFSHIVLNDGQWSVGFVLDSNALSVIKAVYDVRKLQKKSEEDEREESSQEKELQSNYHKELLVAQENIKSLQERLLELETEQGKMDGWIDECHVWTNERMDGQFDRRIHGMKGWINE